MTLWQASFQRDLAVQCSTATKVLYYQSDNVLETLTIRGSGVITQKKSIVELSRDSHSLCRLRLELYVYPKGARV